MLIFQGNLLMVFKDSGIPCTISLKHLEGRIRESVFGFDLPNFFIVDVNRGIFLGFLDLLIRKLTRIALG